MLTDAEREAVERHLPLRYENGPDYCEVFGRDGEKVALTPRPELFQALESAVARLSGPEWEAIAEACKRWATMADSYKSGGKSTQPYFQAMLALGRRLANAEGEG